MIGTAAIFLMIFAAAQEPPSELVTPNGQISEAIWSHDGKSIDTFDTGMTFRIWDVKTGKQLVTRQHTGLGFSVDRRFLSSFEMNKATLHDDLLILDQTTGKPTKTLALRTHGRLIGMTPDGGLAVFEESNDAVAYDTKTGRIAWETKGHTDFIFCADLSRDGKVLVTGSRDQTVRVWNLKTGKPIRVFTKLPETIRALRLTKDGKTVVFSSSQERDDVKLARARILAWSLGPEADPKVLEGPENGADAIDISPDDKTVLITERFSRTIALLDLATGKELGRRVLPEQPATFVQFSPDGRRFLYGGFEATLRIMETSALTAAPAPAGNAAKKAPSLTHGTNGILSAVVAGPWLATTNETDIRLWDSKTLEPLGVLQDSARYRTVGINPSTKQVLAAGAGKGRGAIWEIATFKRTGYFDAGDGLPMISADGDTVVGLGNQGWNAMKISTAAWADLRHKDATFIGLSANGTRTLSGETHLLRVFELPGGKELAAIEAPRFSGPGALSPDGAVAAIVTTEGSIELYDTSKGKLVKTISVEGGNMMGQNISQFHFSRDGRRLAGLSLEMVKVWDVGKGELAAVKQVERYTDGILWSEDGKFLYIRRGPALTFLTLEP